MRQFALVVALLLVTALIPQKTYADTSAASSAALTSEIKPQEGVDLRVQALTNVFGKYDSPLTPYAQDYIKAADKYNLDWKLLPAISGLESTFGKVFLNGTYNAYGWGGGYIYFKNWQDGIETINKSLREDYMNKWGAKDVWTIGPFYAESPTWSVRVNRLMNEIDSEYIALSVSESLKPNL